MSSQKTQPSQRAGEGRIYYLQQVRRTLEIFPKAVSPQQPNWGRSKLRVHAYSWRGLSRGEFSMELGQKSTEAKLQLTEVTRARKGQHHHLLCSSQAGGWALQANLYHWNRIGSLYNWFIISAILTSLPKSFRSSVPLQSLLLRPVQGQALWPGLDHKMV